MKLLTKEQQESYENPNIFYICKEKFGDKFAKYKKYLNLGIIFIIQGNIEVLRIAYVFKSLVYWKKFLQFLTKDLTINIILSWRRQQKNLKDNLLV